MPVTNLLNQLEAAAELLKHDLDRRLMLCRDNNTGTFFITDVDQLDDLVKFYNTQSAVAVCLIHHDELVRILSLDQFDLFELYLITRVDFHRPDPRNDRLAHYIPATPAKDGHQ
jgi:hypothetical protein